MKRRILLVVLIWFFLISVACSIGAKDNEYNEEKMVTLTGEEILLAQRDDVYTNEEFGFGFVIPNPMLDLRQQGLLEIYSPYPTVTLMTFYSRKVQEIMAAFASSGGTEAEWNAMNSEIQKYMFNAAVILRLPPETKRVGEAEFLEYVQEAYAVVEEIARIDETVYYFAYNTDYSDVLLSDSEQAQLETVINELKGFEKNIFVFNAMSLNLRNFETKTLDGATVTEDIFKDYKITMINIWATWCGPCIDEMPDLAKLHSTMLPDDANMITILNEGSDSIAAAHEIIDSVSGEFMTLLPSESLQPLLNTITAIPTTIFVDSEGAIVGEPIMGVPGRDPAEAYLKIIEQLLLQQ